MNIEQLKENSAIHPTLIDEVVNQFGGWDEFTESAKDAAEYGLNGGFSGFIYYSETTEFFDNNKPYILAEIEDKAEQMGDDVILYIDRYLNSDLPEPFTLSEIVKILFTDEIIEHSAQLKCLLVWDAAQIVCGSYCRILEESN